MQNKTSKQESKMAEFWDALGNKAPSTIAGYKTAISQLMRFVYPDCTDIESTVDEYFNSSRNYFKDFKTFIQSELKNKPGLSALQTFNQIKNFYALSDVVFSPKEVKQLKNQLPVGKTLTQESDMDTEMIRAILQHTDVKMKAIILCLASGGMRIGELLNVRCDDVNLTTVPACIQIRGNETKTGVQRYTFISSEAVCAVREWIKVRPAYLKAVSDKAQALGKGKKNTDDARLFPLSDTSVNKAFIDAVTKAQGGNKKDINTGRSATHIHQFRKFFISQLSLVTSEAVADFFAGHKSGLSDNYRRYTSKQMSEYYLKGEHLLYIEAPSELREIASTTKKEIDIMKDDTLKNHSVLLSLMNDKSILEGKVKAQTDVMTMMLERMEHLEKILNIYEDEEGESKPLSSVKSKVI